MKRSVSSRRGNIAELKGLKSTRLLLQMEAIHSQLTVYRSTASVPGWCTTVGFSRARKHSAANSSGCAAYTGCFGEKKAEKRNYIAQWEVDS